MVFFRFRFGRYTPQPRARLLGFDFDRNLFWFSIIICMVLRILVYSNAPLSEERSAKKAKIASLYTGRLHKILMVVFKSLFVSTYPGYLKELFVFRNCSYSLRGKNILTLPIPRTTNYGLECIGYQAAKIWNSLPDSMRTMTSFKDFKKAVKKRTFKS